MCNGIKFVFLLIFIVKSVFGENILHVAAVASPSHYIWNSALAFGLAQKGHNVTFIGPDEAKQPTPGNYTHILLEDIYDQLNFNYDMNEMATYSGARLIVEFTNWCMFQCQLHLKTDGLRKLLNYPPDFKFDLIIMDITVGSCFYPLIERFNYAPTIGVTPFLLPIYVSHSLGNHLFPSYIPWYGFPYTTDMNFMQRVWNFIHTYGEVSFRHSRQIWKEHEMAKSTFGENIPRMEELERHISLLLANTDPVLDFAQPVPPNIIPVGGLHTRKSKKIPQELQTILDNAKHGVIIFSLGTNIRSDKLDKSTQQELLKAFSNISETVIWKFESEMENVPKNVIVRRWLPQNDILGHPNVKLFIGHGGALSTQEAIFHGVPILLVPFAFDQHINAKIVESKKLGIYIDFRIITSGYVLTKLREVLDSPLYYRSMKKISKVFKDRLETPLERGIFWAEYVMRNGGADFLNPQGRNLSFYVLYGLDVIIFLIVVICTVIFIAYKFLSVIFKIFNTKKKIKAH